MIQLVVALAALALGAVVAYGAFGLLRQRERQWERREQAWERERKQLLDRVMYLSDRPWEPPPPGPEPFQFNEPQLIMAPEDLIPDDGSW